MTWKPLAAGAVGAVLGFLLQSNGPLGALLWPMPADAVQPEGANLVLLMVVGIIEALAFGLGLAFLVAAYPLVRRRWMGSAALSWGAYLAIAWVLVNWVPHTALHMAVGNILTPADYTGLVAIEYGFHLTLVAAGATLAYATARRLRAPATEPAPAPRSVKA